MARRNFVMPSFEDITKRVSGGSDLGGLGRANPLLDNPLINPNNNRFSRTFSGRVPVPTVAPVPSAVQQITGRHEGSYIPESEGARAGYAGRHAAVPTGRHQGEYIPEDTGSRASYAGAHRAPLPVGRHKGQGALGRMWGAISR